MHFCFKQLASIYVSHGSLLVAAWFAYFFKHTMASFECIVSLWFVTACYVIFGIYMVKAIESLHDTVRTYKLKILPRSLVSFFVSHKTKHAVTFDLLYSKI